MAAIKLPQAPTIRSLSTEERAHILDLLFEPSVQLRNLSLSLLQSQPFASYTDLVAAVELQLTALADSASTSDTQWLQDILGSHPRLGARKVDSAQSAAEQVQLQGPGAEAQQLAELNEEYERTFPGLRYVVFVQGRPRNVIMDDMRNRIAAGDLEAEKAANIRAMCEIAVDRAAKLT